jgi:hypothetical protein
MKLLRSRATASRFAGATIAVLATLVIVGAPANAAAAPIGANGVINACYKAKGKGKGTVRVVPAGKKCKAKKGEKPIAWSAAGAAGAPGPQGAQGPAGTGTADLLALIDEQILRIDLLEGLLTGVSNGDLEGLLATMPDVCDQLSAVTGQTNALAAVIEGLGLNPVLEGLGGLLEIPTLPDPLDPFTCPAV